MQEKNNRHQLQSKNSEKNNEWNTNINRSPSPISNSFEKINKLKGILNTAYSYENSEKNGEESNKNKDQTLCASRNYLIQGKSFCFH